MNTQIRVLRAVVLAVLCIAAATGAAAQQPRNSPSFSAARGQSVFVAAVRGDCERARPRGIINGREVYDTEPDEPADARSKLNPPNAVSPSERITTLLEPDVAVKTDVERKLIDKRALKVVDSPDQADFVFHVCSRYLRDVYEFPQAQLQYGRVPPNRRLSAEALVLPVPVYKRNSDSYRDLRAGSLWKAGAREFALPKKNPHIRVDRGGPGKEDQAVMIRSGPAQPPPPDASIKELVDALIRLTR